VAQEPAPDVREDAAQVTQEKIAAALRDPIVQYILQQQQADMQQQAQKIIQQQGEAMAAAHAEEMNELRTRLESAQPPREPGQNLTAADVREIVQQEIREYGAAQMQAQAIPTPAPAPVMGVVPREEIYSRHDRGYPVRGYLGGYQPGFRR